MANSKYLSPDVGKRDGVLNALRDPTVTRGAKPILLRAQSTAVTQSCILPFAGRSVYFRVPPLLLLLLSYRAPQARATGAISPDTAVSAEAQNYVSFPPRRLLPLTGGERRQLHSYVLHQFASSTTKLLQMNLSSLAGTFQDK